MHGPPTIDNHLALVEFPLAHSSVAHTALLTMAFHDTSSGLSAQSIADALQTAFNTNMAGEFDDEVTLLKPEVVLGDGTDVPTVATAAGDTVAGTNAITAPMPTAALLWKKITALGGRKNRGRNYIPWCCSEAHVDEAGRVDATVTDAVRDQMQLFVSDAAGADLALVIANRTYAIDVDTGKRYVSAYTIGPVVNQTFVEQYMATQRRRMPRPS